jgi:FkbM family methyltransferase
MMLGLKSLLDKHKLTVSGLLHIGAHYGQEYEEYIDCGVQKFVFFEPLAPAFEVLKSHVGDKPNVTLVNKAIGPANERVKMFVESANQGMSSSMLKPKFHIDRYPHIVFDDSAEVEQVRLDDWAAEHIELGDFNMINIDVQGYELPALQSAPIVLQHMDAVYAEVNKDELYEGCTLVGALDAYLAEFGLSREDTGWYGSGWGEAFYVRKRVD